MPTRISRPLAAAVLIGATAAIASACSSGSTPSSGASSVAHTTAPVAASTPGSSSGPAAEAVTAYDAMWKDVAEAINTDDYQAPYLSDHLAGQALLTITDNMAADKKQGVVGHGTPVPHPVVTSATASTVAISDCLDARTWLAYQASTGKLVNNTPGGFRATTATVTDQDGTWKVTQINTEADGTCHLSSPTG